MSARYNLSQYTTNSVPFAADPAAENRDLIDKLQEGMRGLSHLQGGLFCENSNPNLQLAAMQSLQRLRCEHNMGDDLVGRNATGITSRTIATNVTYNGSAVNDMNMNELDVLLEKNEKRIKEIKDRFSLSQSEVPTARDALQEDKKNFECRERFKDNSLAYPSYGRGLVPNIEMNTFMV